MKIGIMGAMLEEVAGIEKKLTDVSRVKLGDRVYSSGYWHGNEVVLVFSRWGKVAAAATVSVLIDRFSVDAVLFIGVAGAASPTMRVGDIVISAEILQHDMDASALPGLVRFEIPLLGRVRFSSPPGWVKGAFQQIETFLSDQFALEIGEELIAEFSLQTPKVTTGLIATGDQFISNPDTVAALRAELPDLLCVEMEGGAVAQVCYEFDCPFLVIRIISDNADHSAVLDFQKFVARVVTPMTLSIASRIVANCNSTEAGSGFYSKNI